MNAMSVPASGFLVLFYINSETSVSTQSALAEVSGSDTNIDCLSVMAFGTLGVRALHLVLMQLSALLGSWRMSPMRLGFCIFT